MTTQVTIYAPKTNYQDVKIMYEDYSVNENKWKWGGHRTLNPGESETVYVWDGHRLVITESELPIANTN